MQMPKWDSKPKITTSNSRFPHTSRRSWLGKFTEAANWSSCWRVPDGAKKSLRGCQGREQTAAEGWHHQISWRSWVSTATQSSSLSFRVLSILFVDELLCLHIQLPFPMEGSFTSEDKHQWSLLAMTYLLAPFEVTMFSLSLFYYCFLS